MINVYLDDYRRCPDGFVLAKNANECIELLAGCEINVLSLDHDLGWGEPTGYDVTRYIVESGRYPRSIYLHTSSPSGKMHMYELLFRHLPEGAELYGHAMPAELLAHLASRAE